MNKKVVISHPTGNQNSRNAVLALQKADLLAQFYTTVGLFSDSPLQKYNNKFVNEIKRRTYDESLRNKTTFSPARELGRLLSSKLGFNSLINQKGGIFSSHSIYKNFDKLVASDFLRYKPDFVYAYVVCALQTFKEANANNVTTVLELSSCYYKLLDRIAEDEQAKNPQWTSTMGVKTEATGLINAKSDSEIHLAKHIVTASNFCKKSLKLYQGTIGNIEVIPYGFPPVFEKREYFKNRKLQILFVGSLSQQKGLSYLFEAVKEFKEHIELTLIGSKPFNHCLILEQNLKKHNYLGTLPHNGVLKEMRRADVLIFPTLMDAFGMVITEAMSQGTPVITTDHSAGPEIITHNKNGWIVNAGNSEQIKVIIEGLLKSSVTEEFGRNAAKKAADYSWEFYQREFVNFFQKIV